MKTLSLLIITLFFTISAIAQPWIEPTAGNIYYQGNVGIGTTSPGVKLEIKKTSSVFPILGTASGNLLLSDNGLWGTYFGLDGGTGTGWIQQMRNDQATAYSLVLNPLGGNVGIGTTNPDALLAVWRGADEVFSGTGYRVAKFNSTATVNADRPGITLGYDTSGGGIIAPATQAGTTNFLGFWTYNSGWGERVRITKEGNVGIGTTNPGAKLDVNVADGLAGFKVTGATGKLRVYPYFDATYGTTIEAMNVAENGYVPMTLSGSKFIFNAGNVGIGTTTPEAKLTVKGKIVASEIQVKDYSAIIPDYVFKPDYQLMSLDKVEDFVKQNQHLPEVPSEKEFKKDGMNVAEMNALLLKKIEELTLYAIEQNKKIEALEKTVNNLNSK